ncbi:MAG TPA: DUF6416 domain-containing protein [Streptosporangiaceae bacterium]
MTGESVIAGTHASPAMCSPDSGKDSSFVCIACVMRAGDQGPGYLDDGDDAMPGAIHDWSAADGARAGVVYRQLPAWSRQLIDMLAAQPGALFPISVLRQTLVEPGSMFGIEEMCEWAAPVCTAVGRHLPVLIRLSASGEPACYMDQVAAGLFRRAADPLAVVGGSRAALPPAPAAAQAAGPGAAAGTDPLADSRPAEPGAVPEPGPLAPGPGAVILPGEVIDPDPVTEADVRIEPAQPARPEAGAPSAWPGGTGQAVRPGMTAGPDGGVA